ncbi:MAG: phage tail tube protein [Pseudomonadota bacterium]
MADAQTMRGEQLLIRVGDGATPTENFAHPCMINTERGISFTTQNNQVLIPDCANPTDPAWTRTVKESMSAALTGAGTLHVPDVTEYFAWLQSPDAKNVQVDVGIVSQTLGGYFSGAFDLTEFEISGSRGNLAEVSLTMNSNGAVTFTPHV